MISTSSPDRPRYITQEPGQKTFEHIELEIQMQRKEQKLEELYEQLSGVERERTRLREMCIRFEEENQRLTTTLEEKKIECEEFKKHIEIYEEKLAQST